MSEQFDLIAPALVKAQAAIPAVHKSATNTFFSNKYAPLDAIMDAALVACQVNDLFIMQDEREGEFEDWYCTETTLIHSSGQWVTGGAIWFPVAPDVRKDGTVMPRTPQNACSGSSYSRRYSLASVLGIVPDDDDDGNAASGKASDAPQRQNVTYQSVVATPQKAAPAAAPAVPAAPPGAIPKSCPVCGGKVYDNRAKKASGEFESKSKDWHCADKTCTTEYAPGKSARTGGWVSDEKSDVSAGIAKMKAALDMSRPIKAPKSKAPDFGPDFEGVPLPEEPPEFDD
jgi:hypothetical protein